MAWTTPRTWTVGEVVDKTILDAHIRDNLSYLKGTAGTVAFDAGATFSGVVTGTGGLVAGATISANAATLVGDIQVNKDVPVVYIGLSGATGNREIAFRASGTQWAALYYDVLANAVSIYDNKSAAVAFSVGFPDGNVTVKAGATIDGVDVSALHTTVSGHLAGTAKAQHAAGVGDHTHASTGAEGGIGLLGFIASGNYSGDGTVNRGIAHGLGRRPKLVVLRKTGTIYWYQIWGVNTTGTMECHGVSDTSYVVTSPNTSSFYVGNSDEYDYSANYSGNGYEWIAMG